MIKGVKFRLKPTKEQELLMWKSVGVARFAYNWGLAKQEENFRSGGKFISCRKLRNELVALKNSEEFSWLKEVSGKVINQAFEDLDKAYKKFFLKKADRPKFKSKRKSKPSFYARYDSMKFDGDTVRIERLGKIKFHFDKEIPQLDKYHNPRISFDGMYWYLSFTFEHEQPTVELTGESIGIDVGVKDLAIVSNMDEPIKNINKSKRVRKIERKLKRLQRQASRKYEMNMEGKRFKKTANIVKLQREIKKVYRRLRNIRRNHTHQATASIVKTKPSRVVMEHLNIQGMMKNKYLARVISEQHLCEFKKQMKYKCEFYGIEFVEADRFFPSSKMCSCCGNIKRDLKLRDRRYVCESCGLIEDRDKNAAINLANYQLVTT